MTASGELLVIGHRQPDLDSTAAAAGYAALLRALGRPARAGRCGPLDPQAELAFRRFGVEPPLLVMDVAPTFGRIARRIEPLPPEAPIAEAIRILADGGRAVPIVGPDGKPRALIDAAACVRRLGKGGLGAGAASEDVIRTACERAAAPCIDPEEAPPAALTFLAGERVSDRRGAVARADADDFLVVDQDGRYLGVATRAAILAPPRMQLVLVDHNEIGQAVPGADEAEIVEVIDHHRLGNLPTREPIPFSVEVIGSTSTLIAERWHAAAADRLEPALAGVLLAGIVSDTLAFRSPTSTARDRAAAERLAARAGVRDLAAFGEEIVAAGAGLGRRRAEEIVREDWKEYATGAGRLLIAQAEVRSLDEAARRLGELQAALEALRESRGAVLGALLVTDVLRGRSRLLACGDPRLVARLPYPRRPDGTLDVGAIVSRKKELVPAVLAALE
jgi:manganese-dependent inorganic pyrophosphatase